MVVAISLFLVAVSGGVALAGALEGVADLQPYRGQQVPGTSGKAESSLLTDATRAQSTSLI